jgi:UPF0716 family protein affecting phage T7 exclusion
MIPLAAIVEWKPLLEALWTSAAFGLAVLIVAGVGVRASLRAADQRSEHHEGAVLGYGAITVGCVALLVAAIVVGIWAMAQ